MGGKAAADKRLAQVHQSGVGSAQLYGRDTSGPNAVYGGLNAFFLLLGQPSVYGLPEKPKLPEKNVFVDSLLSIGSAIVIGLGAVMAFRSRGGPEGGA